MGKEKKDISIIELYDMESPEATEFRRVLHNLRKSSKGGEKRTVLITSATLSEGKSLVASFLALTSARHKNNKTLLIDYDLRRPSIHKLFAMTRNKGISEITLDGLQPRNAIKPTGIDKLDVITAGRFISNPSDMLNPVIIHEIINEMKFYYDLILVDSPPLIPVIDPLILIEELDVVFLVIKAGVTQKAVVGRAGAMLSTHNGKFVGVILNNLNKTLPYYYNYNYYGYQYKSSEN